MEKSKNILIYTLFIVSFLLTFSKIVFHLNFFVLPVFFTLFGFISYGINKKKSITIFLFIFPFINSLPDIFNNGYPYNYMMICIFYLSGIVLSSIVKRERLDFNYRWFKYYELFLVLLFISALFVFIRWGNLSIPSLAYFKDTLVTPSGERLSFASIFPVITLSLFIVPPFISSLIKTNNLQKEKLIQAVAFGYLISFVFAVIQKFLFPEFLSKKYWSEIRQLNGGSSDFNAFGFFSGFIFLFLTIIFIHSIFKASQSKKKVIPNNIEKIKKKKLLFYVLLLTCSFFGLILSGSRTSFLFLVVSAMVFLFSKKIKPRIKLVLSAIIIICIIALGGIIKERVYKTGKRFVQILQSEDFISALDKASNNRITMIKNSLIILKKYPLTGVGAGNFLFYLKKMHFGKDFLQDNPLNQYLFILDEIGSIGLIPFLIFLFLLIKEKKTEFSPLLYTILFVMVVGCSLWLPEISILFWVLIGLISNGGSISVDKKKSQHKSTIAFLILILLFVVFNMIHLNSLHPLSWAKETNTTYDYGLWEPDPGPEGNVFRWTKKASGFYIYNKGIRYYKLFSGAPIQHLNGKKQIVKMYWRGKTYKDITFTTNKFETVEVNVRNPGFLELRVYPTFNLKQMNLGNETRDLGVQLHYPNSKIRKE